MRLLSNLVQVTVQVQYMYSNGIGTVLVQRAYCALVQVHSTRLQRVQHHRVARWQGQHQGLEGGPQPILPGHPAPGSGHCRAWGYRQHLHAPAHATEGGTVALPVHVQLLMLVVSSMFAFVDM